MSLVGIGCICLCDSTGWGLLDDNHPALPSQCVQRVLPGLGSEEGVFFICPGASLVQKGQNPGQCAILALLSKTAAVWAEKVGSDRMRARKVSVIFIPAAGSLPCQGNGKLEERFRALLQYRKELRIPETNRAIMSYTDAFLNRQGQVPFFFSRRLKSFSGDGHRCCEARADHFRGLTAHCGCRVRWVECRWEWSITTDKFASVC